jgi:hypothetical protein
MATYFHMALPLEQRSAVYANLVRYLARIRRQPLRGAGVARRPKPRGPTRFGAI